MPRKSIVIGLGGTGDWVLAFLKSRLFDAYGEDAARRDVQFLLVDTIHHQARDRAFTSEKKTFKTGQDEHEELVASVGEVRVESHEYLPIVGDISSLARSIDKGEDEHTKHLSWFQAGWYLENLPSANLNIADGAGQWRQFGRIAIVQSAEKNAFPSRIDTLLKSADPDPNEELIVYVVSSLAGGTGAGSFLDAAILIRDAAKTLGKKIWIIGFLVLPNAFQAVLGKSRMPEAFPRGYSALRELERFQTIVGHKTPFPVHYSLNYTVGVEDRLYDTVFLVDADAEKRDFTLVEPWSGLSPSVADGIEVFLDRTSGANILENLCNAAAASAGNVKMDETLPAQFNAIGSYKIQLPARAYPRIFSSRVVAEFLEGVFPLEGGSARSQRKLKGHSLAPTEFENRVLDFLGTIPPLFTQLVRFLPGRPENKKLPEFAKVPLENYLSFVRPDNREVANLLSIFREEPLANLLTGRDTGEPSERATNRMLEECDKKQQEYWERTDSAIDKIIDQIDAEMSEELEKQILNILNREIDQFSDYPVGAAQDFLNELTVQCDVIDVKIINTTTAAINAQADGTNAIGSWKTQVKMAQTAMESTIGNDRFYNKAKAHAAQKDYLETLKRYVDRNRIEKVFDAYKRIVERIRARVEALRDLVVEWGMYAVVNEQFSAHRAAKNDQQTLEDDLRRAGECYTSSYGLSAYERDEKVDITMGGYMEELYDKYAVPVREAWAKEVHWRLDKSDTGELQLILVLEPPGRQKLDLGAKSIYRDLVQPIREEILPQITQLSIFDYFAQKGISASDLAEFLHKYAGPLLGTVHSAAGHVPIREIYLLAKVPPGKAQFMQELESAVRNRFTGVRLQTPKERDFDNPFTLVLLFVVQNLIEKNIERLGHLEENYNRSLSDSDVHKVNQVFLCEEEAAAIEQTDNKKELRSANESVRLHPRVYRLLDNKERVRQFIRLWALDLIRLAPTDDPTVKVWKIVDMEAPGGRPDKSVWLNEPPEAGSVASILVALEQFVFKGLSARPGRGVGIGFGALEGLLRDKKRELIDAGDGGYGKLIHAYESFLSQRLPKELADFCARPHNSKEMARHLEIIVDHYLSQELETLKITA